MKISFLFYFIQPKNDFFLLHPVEKKVTLHHLLSCWETSHDALSVYPPLLSFPSVFLPLVFQLFVCPFLSMVLEVLSC